MAWRGVLPEGRPYLPCSHGTDFAACFVMQTFSSLLGDSVPPEALEIPSETTSDERKALFNFFATLWDGQGDICEIGPFLGGTTRAIAMGMLRNSRRSAASRLLTYDKFASYYEADALIEKLRPLIEKGRFDPPSITSCQVKPSFRAIFDQLHRGQDYSHVVIARTATIPDLPGQVVDDERFQLDSARHFGAVFVDGCKSWFGTKHCMREAARCTRPGGFFIFQDYGFHTCFWIPSFVAAMGDVFHLRWAVDYTYAFELTRALDPAEIDRNFPDLPQQWDRAVFDRLFLSLIHQADDRGDTRGIVTAYLQHAAALAYLGVFAEARAEILEIAMNPVSEPYRLEVALALSSPTYRPDGRGGFEEIRFPD